MRITEDTLIIATQSSLIASSTHFDFPDFATMNQPPVASPSTASSWDTFGTENVIRLCEVKLLINRFQVGGVFSFQIYHIQFNDLYKRRGNKTPSSFGSQA